MCAAYNVLPTNQDFLLLSDEQLHWLKHFKQAQTHEWFDSLAEMLGLRMTSETFYGDGSKTKKPTQMDSVTIPGTFAFSPDPERLHKFFESILRKPQGKTSGDGTMLNPISLGDTLGASALRDIFSTIKREATEGLTTQP